MLLLLTFYTLADMGKTQEATVCIFVDMGNLWRLDFALGDIVDLSVGRNVVLGAVPGAQGVVYDNTENTA